MSPEQFKRVSELFLEARQQPPAKRADFLDNACADDAAVRREVERMLQFDSEESIDSGSFVVRSPGVDTIDDELFPPGSRIGEYTVVRTLGTGGMGRVLEVKQERPRRHVAIKLLRQDLLSQSMLKRFDHEVRVLGEMQHEGIARIHAAGWTDAKPSQPFFTMELIDGVSLNEYAAQTEPSTHARLNLIAKVCDAVQYAHQRGVIHRDLKPANIMVDAAGNPKVVDFGIARITDTDQAANTMQTVTGQLIGTLPYMSPEQIAGDPAKVDSRTDVYSLGVILYELLSGAMPHDLTNTTLPEAARLVQETGITRLGAHDRTLRGDIETIVAKALEKEPERRYSTASELAADIRRYLSDQPIIARPPSAIYQLGKFARRHRAVAAAGIIAFLAMASATVVASVYAIRTDRANKEAQRQTEIAAAINRFLNEDLLAAVSPSASREAGRGRDVAMADVLAEAARRIETASASGGALANKPEVEASIRATIGRTFFLLGDIQTAYPHLQKCYDIRKANLPPGHIDTLQAAVYLGGALYQLARLDDAIALYQEALSVARPVLGDDNSIVLDAEFGFAIVVWRQRDLDRALELFQHIYDARIRNPDSDRAQLDAAQLNIAMIYSGKGDHERALPIFRAALARKIEAIGKDHPVTLQVANNLGVTLMNQERYEEAAELMRDVLEDRRRVLGPDHYQTLSTCINLGSIVSGLGDQEEAAKIYRNGYEASLAKYGPDHGRTLTLAFGLANVIKEIGQIDEAEELLTDTIERRKSSVGMTHPRTLAAIYGLFELRLKQERHDDAETLLTPPIDAIREAGELADYDLYVEALIDCRIVINKRSEALELADAYLAALQARHGKDSEPVQDAAKKLAVWRQNANSKPR